MGSERVVPLKPPELFRRYPNPSSDKLLAGSFTVDLGEWIVAGERQTLALRVSGEELQTLAERVFFSNHKSITLGYGSLQVFKVAGYWDGKNFVDKQPAPT